MTPSESPANNSRPLSKSVPLAQPDPGDSFDEQLMEPLIVALVMQESESAHSFAQMFATPCVFVAACISIRLWSCMKIRFWPGALSWLMFVLTVCCTNILQTLTFCTLWVRPEWWRRSVQP